MKSYSLRSLLFATVLLALIFGWVTDRANLSSQIQKLNSTFTSFPYKRGRSFWGGVGEQLKFYDMNSRMLNWLPLHRVRTGVESERLAASLVWRNDSPNPPVSASEAIGLADATIPTLAFPGPDGIWQRRSVTLTPVKEHWIWVVRYSNAEDSPQGGNFSIVVLMDGSVLKPHYHPVARL